MLRIQLINIIETNGKENIAIVELGINKKRNVYQG
jgi:hypothetical protein